MKQVVLKRSSDAVLGGVCAGLAEIIGWSPTRVRVAYVVLSILSAAFPGALVYIALWILLPPADYEPPVDAQTEI